MSLIFNQIDFYLFFTKLNFAVDFREKLIVRRFEFNNFSKLNTFDKFEKIGIILEFYKMYGI